MASERRQRRPRGRRIGPGKRIGALAQRAGVAVERRLDLPQLRADLRLFLQRQLHLTDLGRALEDPELHAVSAEPVGIVA